MKFSMIHLFVDSEPEVFTEDNPPNWLTSNTYAWWYADEVLTLEIGESIDSDFRQIKRIE